MCQLPVPSGFQGHTYESHSKHATQSRSKVIANKQQFAIECCSFATENPDPPEIGQFEFN